MPPTTIDAVHFSPQNRQRFFWGNIPKLNRPVKKVQFKPEKYPVSQFLNSKLDRIASTTTIGTITTNRNSLKQGPDKIKIALMNNQEDNIWISEIEEIFGLKQHYTDVADLSITKRQRLIGKSWCVQVIKEILEPLTDYFEKEY